jgi:predicted ribosomally synthesized peptide with SipW-like signal peptide
MVVVGLVGGGAFAWFTDTETSSGNTFTAGSLDLAMRVTADGEYLNPFTTDTIATPENMEPGKVVGPYYVGFKNVGSIDGNVFVTMSIDAEADVETQTGEFADTTNTALDATASEYAAKLVVTSANLDTDPENKAPWWAQQIISEKYNNNVTDAVNDGGVVADSTVYGGYLPTVYGLSLVTLRFIDPVTHTDMIWSPTDTHNEVFSIKLSENADNKYMFDGVSISLKGIMLQVDDPTDAATVVVP